MENFARYMMIAGVVLFAIGGLLYAGSRLGIPLGRLPGDIRISGENVTCLIPLATSILLSIILTIALNIILRMMNR
jgi:hypothetical protein